MQQEGSMYRSRILGLVSTWILCFVFLAFSSANGFSFEHGGRNSVFEAQSIAAGWVAEDADNNLIVLTQNFIAYFLCIITIAPFVRIIGREILRNLAISALLLWVTLSFFWSVSAVTSGINAIRIICCVALAIYLPKRYAVNDLLKLLLLVGSVAATASLAMVLFFPQYGLQNRSFSYAVGAWQGIFGQKNICGLSMTLLLLPVFFVELSARFGRVFKTGYVFVVLVIIAETQSVGSWVVTGLCLVFVAGMTLLSRVGRRETHVWVLGFLSIAVGASTIVYMNSNSLLSVLGKDPTMTGRTAIWASLLRSVEQRPVLGYGFRAFWKPSVGSSSAAPIQGRPPGLTYAENGVLELWLDSGAVGVALYLLIYLRAVKNAIFCFRRNPSPAVMWYATLLFYVAATNIEGGYLMLPSLLACILPFVAYWGLGNEASHLRLAAAS